VDDFVKSVVVLLFIFGCVAVIYAVYRVRRTVNATNGPAAIFKESGNLTETVRRLYAHETTPDAYRMSSSQRDYVRTNLDEFVSLHREDMERLVDDVLARFREKIGGGQRTDKGGGIGRSGKVGAHPHGQSLRQSLVRASRRRVANGADRSRGPSSNSLLLNGLGQPATSDTSEILTLAAIK